MKKLMILSLVLAGMFLFGTKAYATTWRYPHTELGKWSAWSEWSKCDVEQVSKESEQMCGTVEGTQSRERTSECKKVWSWDTNECTENAVQKENQSCTVDYGECEVLGCTDESALNYNSEATKDDESCEYAVEPEPTPESTPSKAKENTFHKDMRCLAVKPEAPQWALKSPVEGGVLATFSAMGGSKVEIQVNNANGEWEYNYGLSDNDGHEFLQNMGMSQLFRIRVVNECKTGDWLIDP